MVPYLLLEIDALVDESLCEDHAVLEVNVVVPRPVDQVHLPKGLFRGVEVRCSGNQVGGLVALEIAFQIGLTHVPLRVD